MDGRKEEITGVEEIPEEAPARLCCLWDPEKDDCSARGMCVCVCASVSIHP